MKYQHFLFSIPAVFGWGSDGHAIVTKVARDLLSSGARNFFDNLLQGDRMLEEDWMIERDWIRASRWADKAEALERYPDSDVLHFSNTPYRNCQPFLLSRDCGSGMDGLCIVTGLADAIAMVIDPEISRENRTDAFKFVLHLMADIHQPLHTGFRDDAGGTAIAISNSPNATLHTFWDYGLIENHLKGSKWDSMSKTIWDSVNKGIFMQRIANQSNVLSVLNNGTRDSLIDYVSNITTETTMSSTCKLAYMNEKSEYISDKDHLSEAYVSRGKLTVQVQLSKAAVRLAFLLDAMAVVYRSREAEQKGVRKAIRIEKLFERMRADAAARAAQVPDPLQGNRFALLQIDIDIDEYLFEPIEPVVVSGGATRPSKRERKALAAALQAKEARRLANKRKRDEKKRIARMVNGIDLSSLVLVKREGVYLITTKSLVPNARGATFAYIRIYMEFKNSAGPIPMGLDYRIFKTVPDEAFFILLFKVIKLEATEEHFADIASVVTPATSQVDPRRHAYFADRFKTVEELQRFEKESDLNSTAHWRKHKDDMIRFSFEVGTREVIFISTKTLCENRERRRFLVNQFGQNKEGSEIFLIDTEFFDDDVTHGVLQYLGLTGLPKSGTLKRSEILNEQRPALPPIIMEFLTAVGLVSGRPDPTAAGYFKECRQIDRTDKPFLTTYAFEFTAHQEEMETYIVTHRDELWAHIREELEEELR